MAEPIDLETLCALLLGRSREDRTLVAVAGAPGSGKSTLAEALVDRLAANTAGCAALLPMDGFHYDDALLGATGRLARKGAPDTFDVGGLRATLQRLRTGDEDVCVPVFDRSLEIARAGARMIPTGARIVVVEGNYLLLQAPPWAALRGLFDVTVMVETAEEELRRRLTRRWEGFGLPAGEVRRKVEENDLPNGRIVTAQSAPADYRLAN